MTQQSNMAHEIFKVIQEENDAHMKLFMHAIKYLLDIIGLYYVINTKVNFKGTWQLVSFSDLQLNIYRTKMVYLYYESKGKCQGHVGVSVIFRYKWWRWQGWMEIIDGAYCYIICTWYTTEIVYAENGYIVSDLGWLYFPQWSVYIYSTS